MFQSYLSEYSILKVETLRIYFHMIELSAYVRRSHMRSALDIKFAMTRLGVPANVRNFKVRSQEYLMSSVAILTIKFGCNIGQILEFAGKIAIYKGGCFNHISQSVQG